MKIINKLKNNEIALKYLNIMLIFVILSMIISMIPFLFLKNGSDLLTYIIFILPGIGGLIASYIGGGIRGILGGAVVGALVFCIGPGIFLILSTLITSPDPSSIVLMVVWIPTALIIGGIAGLIGGFIGFLVKAGVNALTNR
ncbi:MAG: hypothetical protein FJ150_03050 [Euryarchaeota archaeon]|nr:hypothetical protein [Euryarchaeota archaeon]